MKYLLFVLSVVAGAAGQPCDNVPIITPNFAYDAVRVADYNIVATRKGFVGQKFGWGMKVCDFESHKWSAEFDDMPDGYLSGLAPDDPNMLFVGFIPQEPGVHYFLFRISDELEAEWKVAILADVRQNRSPKVWWIRKMLSWIFD